MPPKYYKKYKKNDFEFKNTNGSIFLVIVESPSKCKKIETYLGKEYKVIASCGHFTKLDSLDHTLITLKRIVNTQDSIESYKVYFSLI